MSSTRRTDVITRKDSAERRAWIAVIEDAYPRLDDARSDWREQSDYYLKIFAADAQEKINARNAARIAAAADEQRASAKASAPEGETARRDAMVRRNRNAWKEDAEADETTDERSKRDAMIKRNRNAWKQNG
jgi:hypothetical protein